MWKHSNSCFYKFYKYFCLWHNHLKINVISLVNYWLTTLEVYIYPLTDFGLVLQSTLISPASSFTPSPPSQLTSLSLLKELNDTFAKKTLSISYSTHIKYTTIQLLPLWFFLTLLHGAHSIWTLFIDNQSPTDLMSASIFVVYWHLLLINSSLRKYSSKKSHSYMFMAKTNVRTIV